MAVPVSLSTALPFQASLPAMRAPGGTDTAAGGASAGGAAPTDSIEIRLPAPVARFTAEAGDAFSLRELLEVGAGGFTAIARYRVALRDDPSGPGGGSLWLRGIDVTGQLDFTPAEFTELQFVAGADGAATDLLVVARQGTSDGAGGLTGIIDSPAVQITATVTGTRSLNAAAALRTAPGADEADFLRLAQDAELFAGLGKPRPALTTLLPPGDPDLAPALLAGAIGAWRRGDDPAGRSLTDLAALYGTAIGASRSNAVAAPDRDLLGLLTLLSGTTTGAWRQTGTDATALTTLAVQAYGRARS